MSYCATFVLVDSHHGVPSTYSKVVGTLHDVERLVLQLNRKYAPGLAVIV